MPRKKKGSNKEKEIKLGIVGVYKITNINNNKVYIGESLNIKRRWKEHINDLSNNEHHSKKLQVDWNSQGKDSFKFEIIQTINSSNYDNKMGLIQMILYVYEDLNIKKYNSVNEEYNMEYTLERMLNNERPIMFNIWENNKIYIKILQNVIHNINENNGTYLYKKHKKKQTKNKKYKIKLKKYRIHNSSSKRILKFATEYFYEQIKNIKFKNDEYKKISQTLLQFKINSVYVYKLLRDYKIFNENNIADDKYIKNNYFKVIEKEYKNKDTQEIKKYKVTLMSKKGFQFIIKLIEDEKINEKIVLKVVLNDYKKNMKFKIKRIKQIAQKTLF
jgi:hypothetical protein